MWDDGSYWWWGFGALHMLLYWGVLILIVAAVAKWIVGSSSSRGERQESRALAVLKERYAHGEIDREEFERKRSDLGA